MPLVDIEKVLLLEVDGELKSKVDQVIKIVRALHQVSEVDSQCPVRPSAKPDESRLRGYFDPRPNHHIGLLSTGPWVESTFIHELGHLWDFNHFGEKTFVSAKGSALSIWRHALVDTECFKRLEVRWRESQPEDFRHGDPSEEERWRDAKEQIEYLRRPVEWWARSYYLWVVLRSRNDMLLSQLDEMRKSADELNDRPHWSNDEFEEDLGPILDDLFGYADTDAT